MNEQPDDDKSSFGYSITFNHRSLRRMPNDPLRGREYEWSPRHVSIILIRIGRDVEVLE
ncbi:hypothetical protein ALC53_02834 [Atta colombica]|uniref:Uncharacterized protein n=1 Tax=Atta colombica TaxID=520822 RepID=A0A195BPB0_9HYME|nr:hypothetical protein ALC53_02834 [Atta colombica]